MCAQAAQSPHPDEDRAGPGRLDVALHRAEAGILQSNRKLRGSAHRLYDLSVTVLEAFGVSKPAGFVGRYVPVR